MANWLGFVFVYFYVNIPRYSKLFSSPSAYKLQSICASNFLESEKQFSTDEFHAQQSLFGILLVFVPFSVFCSKHDHNVFKFYQLRCVSYNGALGFLSNSVLNLTFIAGYKHGLVVHTKNLIW